MLANGPIVIPRLYEHIPQAEAYPQEEWTWRGIIAPPHDVVPTGCNSITVESTGYTASLDEATGEWSTSITSSGPTTITFSCPDLVGETVEISLNISTEGTLEIHPIENGGAVEGDLVVTKTLSNEGATLISKFTLTENTSITITSNDSPRDMHYTHISATLSTK